MTGADGQPAPASDRSSSPVTFIHDDVTVQVPTTSPPQGSTLEHAAASGGWLVLVLPPLPREPPFPVEPALVLPPLRVPPPLPELPPVPPDPSPMGLPLQPRVAIAPASTTELTSPTSPFRMRPPTGTVAGDALLQWNLHVR